MFGSKKLRVTTSNIVTLNHEVIEALDSLKK